MLKKSKTDNKVLFIDASAEFTRQGNKNKLTDEHQQTILDAFIAAGRCRTSPNSSTHAVIADNGYNIAVSSYVEAEDTREAVDITELNAEIAQIVARQSELRTQIDAIVADLEENCRCRQTRRSCSHALGIGGHPVRGADLPEGVHRGGPPSAAAVGRRRAGRREQRDLANHFTGSIVYIGKGQGTRTSTEPDLLIDGQQRVTTVTLLLGRHRGTSRQPARGAERASQRLRSREDQRAVPHKRLRDRGRVLQVDPL